MALKQMSNINYWHKNKKIQIYAEINLHLSVLVGHEGYCQAKKSNM